jgi:hypothetical protein
VSQVLALIVARIMGIFSSPSTYVPPLPPMPRAPDPPPPQLTDKALSDAAVQTQARARSAAGFASTVASSPQGVLGPAPLGLKTLLGQ